MTQRDENNTASRGGPGAKLPGYAAVEQFLSRQERLYGELDELSASQGALIEADRTDDLLRVLEERQRIIDKIQALNDALSGVRADWDRFVSTLQTHERDTLGERLGAITTRIESIARRDAQDRDRLRGKRDDVAGELGAIDRTRQASAAYGKPAGPTPIFQDRSA